LESARSYTVQGIVLRHYALKENDKILVLFTRDQGLKRVVGKGMRKPNTRLGGRLEPLRENQVQLARGKNMDVVAQAEGVQRFPAVTEDLDRLAAALAAAEVLMAFLEDDDPAPEVYDLYVKFLAALGPDTDPQIVSAAFELQVLELLGYRPELEACLACERDLETGADVYALNIEAGGAICRHCGASVPGRMRRMSQGGWLLMRLLQETPLDGLAGVTAEPNRVAGLRRALREYLSFRAEKDLKAQGMFEWIPTTAPA
jgi:DNA repair protein RecO (recombination protein O)